MIERGKRLISRLWEKVRNKETPAPPASGMSSRSKVLLLCASAILFGILGGTTLAYFTADDMAHNVITSGGVDIAIIEQMENEDGELVPFPKEGVDGVMPSRAISKIVSVANTGPADAWVRLHVEQTLTGSDGNPLPQTLPDGTPVMGFAVEGGKWLDGGDGYYYYTEPLAPGAVTEPLFKEVVFAKDAGNAYQGCTSNIIIHAQAVQVANNGATVLEAAGWPNA